MTEPVEKLFGAADHWSAVDRLTQPTRQRLIRDDGSWVHVSVASLLDQLVEALDMGSESGGSGGVPSSRPPTNGDALSLLVEITGTIRDALRQRKIKRTFDTAKDLRALTSAVNRDGDPDRIDQCVRLVRYWISQVKLTIDNDPDRSWRMHGAECTVCRSTTVQRYADGEDEPARVPALVVRSHDGKIESVTCEFCGSKLEGPDLTRLVNQADMIRATRQAETG